MRGRVRHARARFAAMVAANSLGSFNENFFKEAAMLVAVASGKSYLQGYGVIIFTLPAILLAAPAGWLSDRFPKRRVIISIKLIEAMAMGGGAYGLYSGNWTLIFIMASLMAAQSVIFSPAVNGLIPELFLPEYVTKANAIIKVIVLAAILIGVAGAGFALGRKGGAWGSFSPGRALVMSIAIGVTAAGFLSSLWVPGFPAASPRKEFPRRGPLDTLSRLYAFRKDRLMAIAVAINVFMYVLGSLQIQVINQLGIRQFHAGETLTGLMIVAELLGFGIGGFASTLLAKGEKWYRALAPSTGLMAVFMGMMAAVPLLGGAIQIQALFVLLIAAGAAGGLLIIACGSFIQIRAGADSRGTVLAAVNFAVYSGVLASGPLANLLNAYVLPTASFGIMGLATLPAAGVLHAAVLQTRKQERDADKRQP